MSQNNAEGVRKVEIKSISSAVACHKGGGLVNNLLEKFGSKPSSGPFNFKLKKTLNSFERDKSEHCSVKSEAEKCTEPMATCLQMENCEKTIMHQQKLQERYSI